MRLKAEKNLSDSEILKNIIEEDMISPEKKKMEEGERYYSYDHDVLRKDFNVSKISESSESGERVRDFANPNRSNHHNVNAFHRLLVDQKVSYILGKRPTISLDAAEGSGDLRKFEKFLSDFNSNELSDTLQNLVIGASNKGLEVLHVYYDEDGNFRYTVIPANEVVLVYDSVYEKELTQVIRYYTVTVIENGRKKYRKRAEWWEKDKVTYYVENDRNEFVFDSAAGYNPSPHFWDLRTFNGKVVKRKGVSWERLPFIVLKNNQRCTTDLEGIKGLIDAYDMISSEGVNNLLDLVELYWVIEGYGGEAASAISRKLKINKAVHISDSSGKIEAKQVNIPLEGRLAYLEMLKRDIYTFGQGVDINITKLGNAVSGTSLKYQYTLLDLKARSIGVQIISAIRQLLYFAVTDFNRRNNTDFRAEDIAILLNNTMIANDSEVAEIIKSSRGLLSDKTLIENHPFVDNVSSELARIGTVGTPRAPEE
ncbi:MAG: phage portal protein [Firmicutes bacterium]|nr:phage portal protein [Bacillota bacterium]